MSKYAIDEQTGIEYLKEPEQKHDFILAGISMCYSLSVLIFLLWLLFDIWYKEYKIIPFFTYSIKESLNSAFFRIASFTFIGGCLGGTIASIRSIISWHCEEKAFGGRFIYKHISQPFIGGTLALFVFAIIRSGIGLIGADFPTDSAIARQTISFFSFGILSGYGSRQVYKWIDFHVNRIFQTVIKFKIPDLKGKSQSEAELILSKTGLKIGVITNKKADKNDEINTIIDQYPQSGIPADNYKEVNITIAS